MQNNSVGCFGLLGIIFILGVAYQFVQTPIGIFVAILLSVLTALAIYTGVKNKKSNDKATLLAMAEKLEAMSNELKSIDPSGGLALKAGEAVYFETRPVDLVEFRSSGSSYSGMNQSVSVPIVKGVRYSVGSSQGSITRNPEQLTRIDTGKAIFTNQRIIFVGPNHTREWELSKLVDVTSGPNGQSISISVSNRQKTSGLMSTSRENLTPGICTSIVQQLHSSGLAAAKKNALDIATGIRQVFINDESLKDSGESLT